MSENPAKLVGLNDRKGMIRVGMDADFCVFDDTEGFTVYMRCFDMTDVCRYMARSYSIKTNLHHTKVDKHQE